MIELLIALLVLGVILCLFETLLPTDATLKPAIKVLVILFFVLYVLQAFGLIGGVGLHLRG